MDWRKPMKDVALATSAAPTIFRAHKNDGFTFVDGGVWANNPIMLGIIEAMSCYDVPCERITVLNRDGGERRLNVAVTRARQELLVFSGFTADQIDPSRIEAVAVQHLKTFLDYAERGAVALPAQDAGLVGGFDSPFEEAVAAQLQSHGWAVVPQVGISGFRIDLGIRHPDLAGAYLAGVECDGAAYNSSATARDRDKVREQVLRGLGWNMLRVWSTDWWFDAKGCAQRLHGQLQALLDDDRARRAAAAERATEDTEPSATRWDMGHEVEALEEIHDEELAEPAEAPSPPSMVSDAELVSVVASMAPNVAPAPAEQEATAADDTGIRPDVAPYLPGS